MFGHLQIHMNSVDKQNVFIWASDKRHTFTTSLENVSIFVVSCKSDYLFITCHIVD